jgi:hypothetical protein
MAAEFHRRMTELTIERPTTDDRPPAEVVTAMVERVMALARTWPSWDGRVQTVDDRVYTPHKAIRRVADHLIDHLADLEARLAGMASLPDRWHASAITTAADLAPFTREDLDEAESRLLRLAQVWSIRLGSLSDEDLDKAGDATWTLREIAFHLEESTYYAEAVGSL